MLLEHVHAGGKKAANILVWIKFHIIMNFKVYSPYRLYAVSLDIHKLATNQYISGKNDEILVNICTCHQNMAPTNRIALTIMTGRRFLTGLYSVKYLKLCNDSTIVGNANKKFGIFAKDQYFKKPMCQ